MLSSLRARLLLWYTLILALVIATFAATLGYLFWRSLVDDIDQGLQASSAALVQGLRPTASGDFDLVSPLEYRRLDATDRAGHLLRGLEQRRRADRSFAGRVRRALARWHRYRHAGGAPGTDGDRGGRRSRPGRPRPRRHAARRIGVRRHGRSRRRRRPCRFAPGRVVPRGPSARTGCADQRSGGGNGRRRSDGADCRRPHRE